MPHPSQHAIFCLDNKKTEIRTAAGAFFSEFFFGRTARIHTSEMFSEFLSDTFLEFFFFSLAFICSTPRTDHRFSHGELRSARQGRCAPDLYDLAHVAG